MTEQIVVRILIQNRLDYLYDYMLIKFLPDYLHERYTITDIYVNMGCNNALFLSYPCLDKKLSYRGKNS